MFAGARRAGEAALDRLHHDSVVGTVAKSIVPVLKVSAESGGSAELKPSSTTVTATTDVSQLNANSATRPHKGCVLYSVEYSPCDDSFFFFFSPAREGTGLAGQTLLSS